jgi:hypothetical protein
MRADKGASALQETRSMKNIRKLAVVLLLALTILPTANSVYADDRGSDCEQSDDDCKREKPRFQTKFFSE